MPRKSSPGFMQFTHPPPDMSSNSPSRSGSPSTDHAIKPETADPVSDLDDDYEHDDDEPIEVPAPVQPMLPVPTAPPQALSPPRQDQDHEAQRGGSQTRVRDVPAFFQNSGLVMRSSEGLIPSNEATLPAEKSFTVQVGQETFRLSGASVQSDAPSYFTRFFEAELAKHEASGADASAPLRTLYVDRDPETFRDIALHLQGYHVQPRDSTHYVRLFADAQFYVLPRLIKHLFESDVFMRIGETDFCIPRDLFDSPGNHPNYFTLGFSLLFAAPGDPFPGLNVAGLLRPPAIKAACASGRSGRIFADILDLLRGYEVGIRDEEHRAALLRDCRYYHLRGLEQQLIPHTITWNTHRNNSEIIMRVEDLRQSGISLTSDPDPNGLLVIRYARPFVDNATEPHELIIETCRDSATIRPGNRHFVVEFHGETRSKIMSLFKVVAAKYAQRLAGQGDDGVATPGMFRVNEDGIATARLEPDALVMVDGEEGWLVRQDKVAAGEPDEALHAGGERDDEPGRKKRRLNAGAGAAIGEPPVESTKDWTVMRAQWRIRLESWKRGQDTQDRNFAIHMYAVNLDVVRGQKGRTRRRGFLES